jgi:hypothetical protein
MAGSGSGQSCDLLACGDPGMGGRRGAHSKIRVAVSGRQRVENDSLQHHDRHRIQEGLSCCHSACCAPEHTGCDRRSNDRRIRDPEMSGCDQIVGVVSPCFPFVRPPSKNRRISKMLRGQKVTPGSPNLVVFLRNMGADPSGMTEIRSGGNLLGLSGVLPKPDSSYAMPNIAERSSKLT